MKKIFLILLMVVMLVGCGISPNDDHINLHKENILSNSNISPFITDEVVTEDYLKTESGLSLNIMFNGTEKFNKLNKDEKYYLLIKIMDVIKKTRKNFDVYGDFGCGEDKNCNFGNIIINYNEDTYEMSTLPDHYYRVYAMDINSEKYIPNDEKYSLVSKGNGDNEPTEKDTETTVENKNGNDWINLSENQKFHAVSNALYNLEQQGYTITETEYYYISALNEFYSDNSTRTTSVSEALASSGVMSGTIYK